MLKVASSDDACFLFMRMSSCADLGSMQQSNHCSNNKVVVEKKGREVGTDSLVRHIFILLKTKERKITRGHDKKVLTIEQEPQRK